MKIRPNSSGPVLTLSSDFRRIHHSEPNLTALLVGPRFDEAHFHPPGGHYQNFRYQMHDPSTGGTDQKSSLWLEKPEIEKILALQPCVF
jgi:hypothetical protein